MILVERSDDAIQSKIIIFWVIAINIIEEEGRDRQVDDDKAIQYDIW